MTTEELQKLRAICDERRSRDEFRSAITPTTVLGLLDEVERLQAQVDEDAATKDMLRRNHERQCANRNAALSDLVAMTAARDELAEIAEGAIGAETSLERVREGLERVAELRKVGAK